ncbi:hypothetical protein ACIG87_14625 [Micromonospora sp. NPDC051925]|uniref:hypothetical protein n=1 Tax=Micromonospora sp. NPDC051925 TaxID=3364288 RepID=UPI0037C79A6D
MDETKERGFLLVATVVPPSDLTRARRTVRNLVLPHQRRIHFHKERDDRRRQIVTAITTIGVQATVFDAVGHRTTKLPGMPASPGWSNTPRKPVQRVW